MLAALLFYGALAALAVVGTWRPSEMRAVGLALAAGFVLSNVSYFLLPFGERPAAFTVVEIGISLAAFIARLLGAPRGMIALISVSVLSVTANIAISLYSSPTHVQIYAWECITNACYAGECLTAFGTGIYARGGFGGLHRWFADRGGAAAHTRQRAE